MSKRAMLWGLAAVVSILTYLVSAGASGSVPSYLDECVGLASLPHWFDSDCSPALVPRLIIVAVGLIPVVCLIYFAEKNRPRFGYHEVAEDPSNGVLWCTTCSFTTRDQEAADDHTEGARDRATASGPEPTSSAGSDWTASSMRPASLPASPGAVPEFKTCPDCAEEVRFAARKCRFCGYLFTEVSAGV